MSLLGILLVIIIVGGLSYLIKMLPIDQMWKNIGYVVIGIFFVVWLFQQLRAMGFDMTI